jgi:hypothetical protein
MHTSPTVVSIGAVCFGIVIGYVTYRTLVRKANAAISDIAAVVSALGGGVVATQFGGKNGDSFGWYSIGLLVGFAIFLLLRLRFERNPNGRPASTILGD